MPQIPRVTPFYGLTAPSSTDVRTGRPHGFSCGQGASASRHDHFFQEFVFHFQFPNEPFGFAQSGSFADIERRLLVGVVSPVSCDPVPER